MSDPHPPPPVMDIRVQLHIEQQHRRSVVEENCRIVEENNSLRVRNQQQAGEIERLSIRLAQFDQKCGSQIKEIGKLKARLQEKASPAPKVYAELPMRAGQLWTYTNDPKMRFVAPADGKYRLLVGTWAASRARPRLPYCVDIRRERPDFSLIVVAGESDGGGLVLNVAAGQPSWL